MMWVMKLFPDACFTLRVYLVHFSGYWIADFSAYGIASFSEYGTADLSV
jgi:hypothetical protein